MDCSYTAVFIAEVFPKLLANTATFTIWRGSAGTLDLRGQPRGQGGVPRRPQTCTLRALGDNLGALWGLVFRV